ncbi:MAG: anaerobic ribonucleoside-triphosphate reductase activating protein [Oscillospiraceae bacterium]|nr:anaerobic ribonucleoside-triphosphate reductase activating protein [Oscillospiraceae bacterium]
MHYGTIKNCDIANGNGVRVTLFVSGCTHHCKGCFNPETWDFRYGQPYTEETEEKLLRMLAPPYIKGLTLLGGEPMEPENQRALLPLVRKAKDRFPEKDIWCYTGYTLESDLLTGNARTEVTDELLSLIDVLVDGEFIEEQKNISLRFRGSENQRLLALRETLDSGKPVLWESF